MFSVYEIKNQTNGKKYIGITSRTIAERFEEHKSRAKCGQRGSRLYDAMRKYGVDNFCVKLVLAVESEDDVREMETFYITKEDSYTNGYNCNYGGHGFLKVPDHVRVKIGNANRGRVMSLDARKKMSQAKKGDSSCSANFGDYVGKGAKSPLSKAYLIQFPDGHTETVVGLRAFCREHKIAGCKLYTRGKTKGFLLLEGPTTIPSGSTLK
jgi:group I intron endonuclease